MATQNKIIEMIYAIKTIYPYYAKETDVQSLVKTWTLLLKDIPDDATEAAFYKALQVCKMPPTPADVLEQVNAMQAAFEPTAEELWAVYYDAIRETMGQVPRFNYSFVDHTGISQGTQARNRVESIWQGLPEPIKKYLTTKGELIRIAQMLQTEEPQWEKQRFMKTLPTIEKRIEYSGMMIEGGGKNLLNGGYHD